ncbi:class A beta-lactamase [Trinickia dinghuensis]|uniref:Beta-lactamase n=2 Tax=Trinickia dinghuensis TaxID=2291023 RepID=A0A3D8JVH4_9BURK|nr:class A beta-lactamase [Trinickia dinghuensis]
MIAGLSTSVLSESAVSATKGRTEALSPRRSPKLAAQARAIESESASIENGVDGRLGVAIQDLETGLQAGHRSGESFAMCSTFKLMLAASVLARVDRREEDPERRIVYGADQLDEYAPITRENVGGQGMTVGALCDAAVAMSDNTAANLLLETIGGPPGFTAFMRQLGDTVTRLDRTEPSLNTAIPGDVRDTTTPAAMLGSMRKVLLGDALSAVSRAQLLAWAVGNRTGATRLRAGVPRGWRVADKTGSGERGTTNDIGVLWPQDRAPILVTVYLTETRADLRAREGAIAEVARAISRHTIRP